MSTSLNFSRRYSGFYEAEGTTMLGDDETEVTVFVCRQDEWTCGNKWSVEVYRKGNEFATHGLVGVSDAPQRTYRDGKAVAATILERGFKYVQGLGWCGR